MLLDLLWCLQTLERNWKTIRDEALAMMDSNTGMFVPEEENLREKGEWGQYTLWQQGTGAHKEEEEEHVN